MDVVPGLCLFWFNDHTHYGAGLSSFKSPFNFGQHPIFSSVNILNNSHFLCINAVIPQWNFALMLMQQLQSSTTFPLFFWDTDFYNRMYILL